jgi:heme/copper-type cytochrome/quinol oxidase subunit 3
VTRPVVRDVSHLPSWRHGHHGLTFWGTLGFAASEGCVFALAVGAFLFLAVASAAWPADPAKLPLLPSTLLTLLLVASWWPNRKASEAAHREDLGASRRWLVVMSVIGVAATALRTWEIWALPVRWDSDAYGSMVWLILGLHAAHLVTDLADTLVLTALMFTRHGGGRRFTDISDNSLYWNFVILAWLPLYLLLYAWSWT